MKTVWNETKIIEAIKTCSTSSEVHKKFSGGWKWLRRNKRFDLLTHLNKGGSPQSCEAVSLQDIAKATPKKEQSPEITIPQAKEIKEQTI